MGQSYVADPPGSAEDTLGLSTQQVLRLLAQPDIQTASQGAERVWFVLFDESNREYVDAGYPAHPHLTWLLQHYTLMEVKTWGDVRVYLFSRVP